jgi:hypothetical protein
MIAVLAEHSDVAYELEPSEPYSSLFRWISGQFKRSANGSLPIFARLEALILHRGLTNSFIE